MEWNQEWEKAMIDTGHIIIDPTKAVVGFSLPRHIWVKLNRFRTGHGVCNDSLFKWRKKGLAFVCM